MINRDSATMHSTRTGNSDDVHADYCMTSSTQATWGSPPQGVPTAIDTSECAGPGSSFSRCSPRKQSLYQLLVEFEKCAQLSEDFLVDIEKVKNGIEQIRTKMEDINLESKMVTDKVKILMKDMQEAKSNHFQLREETSQEFRKLYKRIGLMEKEMDMINYRQKMAAKKHQLEMEALKWEMRSSGKLESTVCATDISKSCPRQPDSTCSNLYKDYSFGRQ